MRVYPLKTLLPKPNYVNEVATLGSGKIPSNVLQAKALKLENNYIRVVKPQFVHHELEQGTEAFYNESLNFLNSLIESNIIETNSENFFLYRQQHHSGIDLCGWILGVDINEYFNGKIKKHENTIKAKEDRLIKHVKVLQSMAEPVLLTQKLPQKLQEIATKVLNSEPHLNVTDEYFNTHQLWIVEQTSEMIQKSFDEIDSLYIADGHHRIASVARYIESEFGKNSHQGIMALVMDEGKVLIKPFYRILRHVNPDLVFNYLENQNFEFSENTSVVDYSQIPFRNVLCITKNRRILIKLKEPFPGSSALKSLDISLFEDEILKPALGIYDSSNDDRFSFVRGDDPVKDIQQSLIEGKGDIAFLFHPNTMSEIRKVADENNIMPPKSTFIEPKLLTGMIIDDYRH